jgi:hypothetical protein
MMASPILNAPVFAALPLTSFRRRAHGIRGKKKPVADVLVFPLKAGNKPSKDG